VTMTWLPFNWLHDLSEAALTVAVVVLGIVIVMELRSIRAMKHALESHLARVFEQLDLLRLENSSHYEREGFSFQASPVPLQVPVLAPTVLPPVSSPSSSSTPSGSNPYSAAAALASSGLSAEEIARRCGLAAGEARLLASLAAARSAGRRDPR
jgi:hypothetical protein